MRLIKKKLLRIPIPQRQFVVNKHYEVKVEEHEYEDGSILVATIWFSLNDQHTYRVFIADRKYITVIHEGTKHELWSDAKIFHHTGETSYYQWWRRHDEKYKVYSDEDTLELLRKKSLIRNLDDALYGIEKVQTLIKASIIEEKERTECARWDFDLDTTPELPADLKNWAKETVFRKERYILYETTKDSIKRGTCTYCGKKVKIKGALHNKEGECPKCHSHIIYKCARKQKRLNSTHRECKVLQMTTRGQVVMRTVRLWQNIETRTWNDYSHTITEYENERIFITDTRCYRRYLYDLYKNKYHRFVFATDYYNVYRYGEDEYTYVAEGVFEYLKGGLQYLPKEIFEHKIRIYDLIKSSDRTGMVERLWKMGLHRLSVELTRPMNACINEKALFMYFGLENDDLKMLKSVDASYEEFESIKEYKKVGKRIKVEDILLARELKIHIRSLSNMVTYSSPTKVLRYLKEQKDNLQGLNINSYYTDYLDLCKELRLDTKNDFVLFPRNLRERHDELVDLKNEKNNKALKKKLDKSHSIIAVMEKALNEQFAVENKSCFIRAPHDAYEIAIEGQKLHHCVSGSNYRDKMKDGKSFIMFARKKEKPDEPWWTIEISNTFNVVQYHGWGNRDKDKKDVEPIMNKLRKRLKKLKEEAEKNRIKQAAV